MIIFSVLLITRNVRLSFNPGGRTFDKMFGKGRATQVPTREIKYLIKFQQRISSLYQSFAKCIPTLYQFVENGYVIFSQYQQRMSITKIVIYKEYLIRNGSLNFS